MSGDYVRQQLQAKCDWLLCSTHKTSTAYGAIAKWLPPGSQKAFEVYLSLPGKWTNKLLEPPTRGTAEASVAGLLKKFGRRAFGMADPPNSNLVRSLVLRK
jgi:hypothetical protein